MAKKDTKSLNAQRRVWQAFTMQPDETTFKAMFEHYYEPLYGYGVKLCNQPEVVKDGIHDIFENLWVRRDELTHIASPNVYLFVSLRRNIMNQVKEQRRNTDNPSELPDGVLITFDREEIIIRDEVKFQQKEELQRALNQLSDRQKEVLYLHYYNGLSYGEIQQILLINRQSVCNHMFRAMETLRSLLDMEIMKLVSSVLVAGLFLGSWLG